jgi:hypothetical protein
MHVPVSSELLSDHSKFRAQRAPGKEGFSGVLANSASLLSIRFLRKEAVSPAVLLAEVPGVSGQGCSIPYREDAPEFYR